MVGGMLACALGNSRFRVAVLEAVEIPVFREQDDYALRVSALNIASLNMLKVTGVWPGIARRRTCPFRRMLVWDGSGRGQTLFDSANIAQVELGHIVENHVLQIALFERLQQFDNIDFMAETRIENLCFQKASARVFLQHGGDIEAKLIVAADGGNSRVRQLVNIDMSGGQYTDQQALVATVETELPQQDITWQRFMPSGPQAFLPLCGNFASLVWYNTPNEVAHLKTLPDTMFIEALQRQFPERLARVTRVLGRGSFPLAHWHANQYVRARLALIGDAAHTVHPLAGQGVNLGLLDAAALAEVLLESENPQDAGALSPLRRYERWRKGHNQLMQMALDGFYHAFKPQSLALQISRNLALHLTGKVAPINHLCMRYASGLFGDLPKLSKGQPLH